MKKIMIIGLLCLPLPAVAADTSPLTPDLNLALTFSYFDAPTYKNTYGINLFVLPEGLGAYISLKTNTLISQRSDNYFDTQDVKNAVDPVTARFKEADMFNVGAAWTFSPYISLYAGLGFADNQGYAELHGPVAKAGQPSFNETYYIKDEANTSSEMYWDAGLLLSYQMFTLQIAKNGLTDSIEWGVGFKVGN